MLFTFNKESKEISLYKETDLASHKILERQDIEKWVDNYPDILGEELLILTTEYDKFDKTDERLDLLAIDKSGVLTIIELKRDDSGKNVELQAIKYAAYCSTLTLNEVAKLYQEYLGKKGLVCSEGEAKDRIVSFISADDFEALDDKPRIIIVSKEYRPEVTATVLWLRKFAVDITCVKLTPYEIGKNTIAFESNVLIPLPDAEEFIIKTEKKDESTGKYSLTKEEYVIFYKDVSSMIRKKIPVVLPSPLPRAYYQIATGIGGVHFEWGFHGRPRSSFCVELHFEKSDADYNRVSLNSLEKMKAEIEKRTGEKVIFQREWTKKWSRLYLEKNEGKMTDELKKWAVDKMVIFYDLLKPELDKLK